MGLFRPSPEEQTESLRNTPIASYRILGKKTIGQLERIGIMTAADLAEIDLSAPAYRAALSPDVYEHAAAMQSIIRRVKKIGK